MIGMSRPKDRTTVDVLHLEDEVAKRKDRERRNNFDLETWRPPRRVHPSSAGSRGGEERSVCDHIAIQTTSLQPLADESTAVRGEAPCVSDSTRIADSGEAKAEDRQRLHERQKDTYTRSG